MVYFKPPGTEHGPNPAKRMGFWPFVRPPAAWNQCKTCSKDAGANAPKGKPKETTPILYPWCLIICSRLQASQCLAVLFLGGPFFGSRQFLGGSAILSETIAQSEPSPSEPHAVHLGDVLHRREPCLGLHLTRLLGGGGPTGRQPQKV